jgi:putative ABC transport system permease protein
MDERTPVSAPDWRTLVRRHAAGAGVDLPPSTVEELALHLEDLYSAARGSGASETDARARAIDALDESPLAILRRHASRDAGRPNARQADDLARAAGGRSLSVLTAVRMAVRQFRLHPAFALVTVLVLGLGTGAATTVFTIVDSVVLRPLPYEAPDRLVTLWDVNPEKGVTHDPLSPVTFMDYRALPVFEDAAAWWRPSINLMDPGQDPVRVNAVETSANLFKVLGVGPQIGAGFPSSEQVFVPNDPLVVISDRLWRARYSADPSIVGRQINLNGAPFTVVGIMPPTFHYPGDTDVWQRLHWDLTQHSRAAHFMETVARLSRGTTFEQAQTAVDALGARFQKEFPASNKGWASRLVPLLDDQLGYYRPALLVLWGAVGLLLLIAVLNVASLLLTRTLSRKREIAVRIAMGASPWQLVTQLLAESLVLSVAGAVVGIAAAAIALPLIVQLLPVEVPRLAEARVEWRALGLGLAIVAATAVSFGVLPAMLLRGPVTTDLKSGERGSSRGVQRVYSVLVAAEVALACALLVSSALLVRTVARMMDTPTGVDADRVVTTPVQLPSAAYRSWPEVSNTHAAIMEHIRQQPGVQTAGGANFLPLETGWRIPFGIEGQPAPSRPEDSPRAQFHSASEGYFEALGAAIARGRSFTNFDTPESVPVVVVNETLARRFLAESPATGRVLLIASHAMGPLGANLFRLQPAPRPGTPPAPPMPPTRFEIVGVIKDIRNAPLGQPLEAAVYFSTRQYPFRELFLAVRAQDPMAAEAAIRTAMKQVVPNVPIPTMRTWGERFAARTAEPRLLMTVLMFFAGLAALLAALGVYGLFSWSVALRTRELAIRVTLGARPAAIGRLVVRQGFTLAICGVAAGVVLIRVAESALTRVLYEVSATDTGAIVIAGLLQLTAALAASVPPALKAMRVDPVEGLRAE